MIIGQSDSIVYLVSLSAWGQSLCAVKFVIKDFILKFLLVLIFEGRCDKYKLMPSFLSPTVLKQVIMPQRERPVAEFTAIIEVAFSDNFTKKNEVFAISIWIVLVHYRKL